MKFFGRTLHARSLFKKILTNIPLLAKSLKFKKPLALWRSYLSMEAPSNSLFELRNGHKMNLSSNPHDGITVMVIFCRNEYGRILKDSIVIDIGANIGAFSLYAAMSGARKVYAFEPNVEAFNVLRRNVSDNALDAVIHPYNFAVAAEDNQIISIPRAASPYNRTIDNQAGLDSGFDAVKTISLKSILGLVGQDNVNLCKIDCEGAEYDILYSTPENMLRRIDHLRLEHHDGERKEELITFLSRNDFIKTHDKNIIMWFEAGSNRR